MSMYSGDLLELRLVRCFGKDTFALSSSHQSACTRQDFVTDLC